MSLTKIRSIISEFLKEENEIDGNELDLEF